MVHGKQAVMILIFVLRVIFSIQRILWIQVFCVASEFYLGRSPSSTDDVGYAVAIVSLIIMDVSGYDYDVRAAIFLMVLKQCFQIYLHFPWLMHVIGESCVGRPVESDKDVIDLRRY